MVSVAQALLSLGRSIPPPPPPPAFHSTSSFHHLPSLAAAAAAQQPLQPLRPIPISALRPIQPPKSKNHFHLSPNCEPENLSVSKHQVKLPQHPSPLLLPPPPPASASTAATAACGIQPSTASAFLQLQSPGHSPSLQATPLKEIQSNRQQQDPYPQVPLPLCLPQQPLPPPPLPPQTSSADVAASVPKFTHPVFKNSENKGKSRANKPFACLECKKSFSTQSGYAKHRQLHCDDRIPKSFSCKYCAKGYTSLSALKMHIRTHTLPCRYVEQTLYYILSHISKLLAEETMCLKHWYCKTKFLYEHC